ncbi:MAG: AhpC/TSA family protein [Bacteroidales bacterium]|nr:AhpC/TSA family protein [Bacteroidales bacterium]
MKNISILALFVAAVVSVACSQDTAKYVVKGTAPEDGKTVYLIDQISSEPIDSAVVNGGSFVMKGSAGKNALLSVNVDGSGWWFLFFNDGKPVKVNVADSTLTGSALNNKLTECDKRNTEAYAEYENFIAAFESLPEAEQEARAAEFVTQYRAAIKKYSDFFMGMIEENMDNLIPAAFIEHVPSLAGDDAFNELLASDAPFAQHPYVLDIKRRMDESEARWQESEVRKQAIVGQKFLDLEEADPNGVTHKLSEYVGKGKWVLVDFWAAWCGPCKAEMPYVVAAYDKYHKKGFDIVGLSFDREKEAWVKAIKEWGMPWIHLSDLKYWQSVASDVYNVNSIPDNLLIDPQGTIVARGLRGEALEAKLSEIFK